MYWKLNDVTKKRISNLETEAAALRERLDEQIEDNGRIHDEKMKYYLQAQDLRERLARLVEKLEYYHMVLSVENAQFLIELSANIEQAIAGAKKQ